MVYVLRDYSPILTVLAMLLLPLALMPSFTTTTTTVDDDDIFHSLATKHKPYLIMTQRLFLATHVAQTLHGHFAYSHLDPAL
ncbi:MAG: hypothetical protein LQ352_004670, partial [Teloschistes flavicans]